MFSGPFSSYLCALPVETGPAILITRNPTETDSPTALKDWEELHASCKELTGVAMWEMIDSSVMALCHCQHRIGSDPLFMAMQACPAFLQIC